ncbi:Hypothetical protein CINCED_3A012024 [Cinara cedri]|uniref:HAT, C-terminal dimerisation domain n=1 Tax=Cinara cedri TaxID=506608 RepID=A0A5E4N150_9HEMI|nr:Hypothetical protein CINCED_3A012024 [Cinara cedri]
MCSKQNKLKNLHEPVTKVRSKEYDLDRCKKNDILNDCSDSVLSHQMSFEELYLWYQNCDYQESVKHNKRSVIDKYFPCDFQMYPVISKLLQILITLPVTTTTGERLCRYKFKKRHKTAET